MVCPKCGGETTLDGWRPTHGGLALIRVLRCKTCTPLVLCEENAEDSQTPRFEFFTRNEQRELMQENNA